MSASRRDYEAVATEVARAQEVTSGLDSRTVRIITQAVAEGFARTNSRFVRERFVKAAIVPTPDATYSCAFGCNYDTSSEDDINHHYDTVHPNGEAAPRLVDVIDPGVTIPRDAEGLPLAWPDPQGPVDSVAWVDAWNGWYPDLPALLDTIPDWTANEADRVLVLGEGLISTDEADRRRSS